MELDNAIMHFAARRIKTEEENIVHLKYCKSRDEDCILNLTAYSAKQCHKDIRFNRSDMNMLCEKFEWSVVMSQNEYVERLVTLKSAFLHKLSTATR